MQSIIGQINGLGAARGAASRLSYAKQVEYLRSGMNSRDVNNLEGNVFSVEFRRGENAQNIVVAYGETRRNILVTMPVGWENEQDKLCEAGKKVSELFSARPGTRSV